MIIEAVKGELVITSESQDEFFLLSKLSGKVKNSEMDEVNRCFSLKNNDDDGCEDCIERVKLLEGTRLEEDSDVKKIAVALDNSEHLETASALVVLIEDYDKEVKKNQSKSTTGRSFKDKQSTVTVEFRI